MTATEPLTEGEAARATSRAEGDAGRTLRTYDFRLPETLERSSLRGLRLLYEALTHRVSAVMSTLLRTRVTVDLGEIEQRSWEDYTNALPEPTCLVSMGLVPLTGRIILHVPLTMAMTLVDLTLGGTGKGRFPERALSEIEQRLVGEMAEALLGEVPTVLAPLLSLRPTPCTQVTSAQFLPAVRPTDMCLIVDLSIDLGDELVFPVELCFPFSLLHPITDALANQELDESPAETADAEAVALRVLDAPVEVSVRFPATTLTPVEFLQLAVGDVIRFPYEQGTSLSLVVGNQHHLDVLPITRGKRLACIVAEPEENPS